MSTKTVESIRVANTGAHSSIPSGPAASAKPVGSVENVEYVGSADSDPSRFTAVQQCVLEALASGASKIDAARAAHVHRDTVNRWEHNVPGFAESVLGAQEEYRQRLASQLRRVSVTALDQLESLLASPETPPSVRLRAVQLVLTRPRFPDKEWALPENINPPALQQLQERFDFFEADYRAGLHEEQLRREQSRTDRDLAHATAAATGNSAKPVGSVEKVGSDTPASNTQRPSEASARPISRRIESETQQAGETDPRATPRNAPCPCGSGQKYKRCCGTAAPPVLHQKAAA